MRRGTLEKLRTLLFYLAVAAFVIVIIFPFIWQIRTSLMPPQEINSMPPKWIPSTWFPDYYYNVFVKRGFLKYLKNSFIVSSMTTLVSLAIASFAAYAIARLQFRGKSFILAMVLTISMLPVVSLISPLFLVLKNLKLLNTYFGLVLPYTTFAMPLAIWNLTAFFREIPKELEESAKVDGCSPMQVFARIMVPLAVPGVFTTAILIFIQAWNEFLLSLTFMTKDAMRTVPVAIALFPGEFELPWGDIAAASVVLTVPLIILVLILQRRIISGLTAGAVKG
ncbi:MAG: carbohydrate ABC transporter permease [Bacillota bacterium]